jgi:nucleoside-diphosphate-sugar epimerase
VARMLVDATDFGDGQVFDAGTGHEVSVRDFAEFVIEATSSSSTIEYLPMRKGEEATHLCAEGEGWDLLGWHPAFKWDYLRETIWKYLDV